MKLRTILGTIMTFALIVIIGVTNSRTVFAKKIIEVNVGSSFMHHELVSRYNIYDIDKLELKGIDVTPSNKGALISYNHMDDWFYIEFKKLGTYKFKFKFANGKSKTVTFKVIDFIESGKAMRFEFSKDGKGNDVLDIFRQVDQDMLNANIKFGNKTVIKGAVIDSWFTYVFKKGYLKKIKFNPKDIKKIKYEVVKGEYSHKLAGVKEKRIENGVVTAIKLHDSNKGHEGYITIGDCEYDEYSDNFEYSSGELYTIKLDKKYSGEWIELEKGIPEDRLVLVNGLRKKG